MATYTAACSQVGSFSYAKYFTLYVTLTDRDGSASTNKSYVDYNVYCQSSGSGSLSANHTLYFKLNGQTIRNQNVYVNVKSPNAYIGIASGTMEVAHNNDGTKSISFEASITATGGYGVSASKSDTFTLTKIPRYANVSISANSRTINKLSYNFNVDATIDWKQYRINGGSWTDDGGSNTISNLNPNTTYSIQVRVRRADSGLWSESNTISMTTYDIAKISAAPNVNIGSAHTITWNNPSGASTSLKLCKTDGTQVIDYGSVTGTSKSVTPTASTIYALTPNSNSVTLRYILTTTQNNTNYTNYKDCVFTVTNSNPTFSNFTFQDTNSKTTALTGNNQIFVKGYSNVMGIINTSNKATAKNSATMKTYNMVIGNSQTSANYSSSAEVNMTINSVTSESINVSAVDSRGNSTKVTKSATIKDYFNIAVASVTAIRTNNVGSETTLNFTIKFWNGNFGSKSNTIKTIGYKYKLTSESSYTDGQTALTYTVSGNEAKGSVKIKGDLGADGFNVQNSYNIQVFVSDELSSATYIMTLGSGNPAIAVYKNNVAIGQEYDTSEGSKLQINGDLSLINKANRININGHKGILKHWTNDTQLCANTGTIYFRPNGDENTTGQVTVDTNGKVTAPHFSGQITSSKGGNWISARDNASVRNSSYGQQTGYSYNVLGCQKTTSGAWTIGNLSGDNRLIFSYTTDANYNTGNNVATSAYLPISAGTILIPVNLYDNSSGTKGTVTLSETASNFSYLEIYFSLNGNRYLCSKVYAPNGKLTVLTGSWGAASASVIQLETKEYLISGTTISKKENEWYVNFNSGVASFGQQDSIKIYRVIGYR